MQGRGVMTDISAGEQFMNEVDDLGRRRFVFGRLMESNFFSPRQASRGEEIIDVL